MKSSSYVSTWATRPLISEEDFPVTSYIAAATQACLILGTYLIPISHERY